MGFTLLYFTSYFTTGVKLGLKVRHLIAPSIVQWNKSDSFSMLYYVKFYILLILQSFSYGFVGTPGKRSLDFLE
jgi:hypothetical protein